MSFQSSSTFFYAILAVLICANGAPAGISQGQNLSANLDEAKKDVMLLHNDSEHQLTSRAIGDFNTMRINNDLSEEERIYVKNHQKRSNNGYVLQQNVDDKKADQFLFWGKEYDENFMRLAFGL